MDEILDFFNPNKPVVKRNVFAGASTGNTYRTEPKSQPNRNDEYGHSSKYAAPHILENNKRLFEKYRNVDLNSSDDEDHKSDPIYTKYKFNFTPQAIPILAHRNEIVRAIRENFFVVLQGPTACGKTTQVPQYILDDAYSKGKPCNIIVAQPRRIAAASNARRVADERKLQVGSLVGYQIGFDEKKHLSEDTRILFCTTGVLLSKLIRTKHFGSYTHIILDEVHERNKDMDFLFVIIRKLFATAIPKANVRVILMSATIQAKQFSEYFSFPKNGRLQPAPIISIERPSKFIVSEFYLDQFSKVTKKCESYCLDDHELNISDGLYNIALQLINKFDELDCEDESDDEDDSEPGPRRPIQRKTVLVFLPGIHEIVRMETVLKDNWKFINNNTAIMSVILHSMSDSQQRKLVFSKTNVNVRKIILATNIAESSITVPDVKYVLDFCRMRLLVTDTSTNFSSLKLSWASRSNCKQRAGRTGRIMNGRCYRFVNRHFYEHSLDEYTTPELVSSPLENVILKSKQLNMGPPASILALAMDQPKLNDIANTILILKEIGALLRTCTGELNDMDGDISFIGQIMANLPIDVKIAKFIILGYCFSILEECIVIGAALNSRSLFKLNNDGKVDMKLYSQQLHWANCSGSDLIAMYHAYIAWCCAHNSSQFGPSNNKEERKQMKMAEQEWANRYRLDVDALNECHVQVSELKARLERLNIKPGIGLNSIQWSPSEKAIILKVVIAGAFYPNYFARSSIHAEDYANDLFKCIGTRDPRNTIYYTGFSRERNRYLYTKSIKENFIKNGVIDGESTDNCRVSFDPGSNKVFVTFKTNRNACDINDSVLMPGKVSTEVYKSMKMSDLRAKSEVWIIRSLEKENEYAEQIGFVKPSFERYYELGTISELNDLCVPRILDLKMQGFITNVEACDRFWFQPENESIRVAEFETYLRNYRKTVLHKISKDEKLFPKKCLVIEMPGCDNDSYHRAQIIKMDLEMNQYLVQLIDCGKILDCQFEQLYDYCGSLRKFIDLPPRCFECGLAQLQPSLVRYPNSIWSIDAINLFRDKFMNQLVEIEIYSLTNGKANVFVKCPISLKMINDILIEKKFGEFVEEDYISKHNHIQRLHQRETDAIFPNRENAIDPMYLDYYLDENIDEVESPPNTMCNKQIKLGGPFNPLINEAIGLTEAVKLGTTSIDRFSVNSILMENDPHDLSQKYLIAATVCYSNSNKNELNLRYTTLMPNIRGFGPLMALIFCPTMQVKTDKYQSHYTALRTGLGYDHVKKRPIFLEHDIHFKLDVEITQYDIELVNQIRYCLDTLLLTHPGEESTHHLNDDSKYHILMKVKSLIIKLMEKPRKSISIDHSDFNWNPEFEKMPGFRKSYASDIYGTRAIYPLHSTLKTESNFDTDRDFLHLHCKQIRTLAQISTTLPANVSCKLCTKELQSVTQLKMHLISREHIDNENRIEYEHFS